MELSIGVIGHLLAWEKVEAGRQLVGMGVVGPGIRRSACSQGGLGARRRPAPAVPAPEAYQQVPRLVRGLDGQIRDVR